MDTTTNTAITKNVMTITEDGSLKLPPHIFQTANLNIGDQLVLCWSPPDTILLRKLPPQAANDDAFADIMDEFGQALKGAGYKNNEDVVKLVQEVKAEQAAEWPVMA